MEHLVVHGGHRLDGSVQVGGAKNAILPLLPAALMAKGKAIIRNVPRLTDVETMMELLRSLGCTAEWEGEHRLAVERQDDAAFEAPLELVRKMRASIWVLAPLLATRGQAVVPLPGGCVIGDRPVDMHIKGLCAMGAEIEITGGNLTAIAQNGLHGAEIYLGGHFGSSVGATVQVMLAGVLAKGKTILHSAACEPEISDLANCLNLMGAKILGAGSPRLEIEGVEELNAVDYYVIPDRIEAATLLMAGAITDGEVEVTDVRPDHLSAVLSSLRQANVFVEVNERSIRVRNNGPLKSIDVTTHQYPGFPTDAQAQLMALLTNAEGYSIISEQIFPDRFRHIGELNRLGANIRKATNHAIVRGRQTLTGARVEATDLRASAALILAGLVAEGETEVEQLEHLDRGYDRLEDKLRALGAVLERVA
ncbi:MAG: UDP-N-acetylglucosamine 1-carboxyvinyltransferase [Planctomycetota bacterium]|nr:UDP-N-acetylglucosamine 1-carboxyvinyltransferase [Planctomycetota bacterium]MDA1143110.1 UDP-N-acetylglucosamine 1-carboxyvinyltransferase [Planctomycetota bacterium]